ncbi:TetR/AcrR family transcriptional regulator [Amycolatopsis sp. NPDC059090]|uniref:TetR/AcrR family transcriptional regulator n=1 Tax=unclassified Amycolatopsis TaxID=2618356 RepID=UPI00366C22D5
MEDETAPYHHGNLRSGLLGLAERALEEGGVAGLSLRGLARELGVSHSAPRQHFADKQALLDALVLRGLRRLGDELDEGLRRATGGFEERLVAFARAYVGFAARSPALLALMFARKDDPARPDLRQASERTFAAPAALIENAMARGEIVGEEPDRTAMAVLAMLQGLASIITAGMIADRSPDAVLTGTVHSLVQGLLPR